MANVTVSLQPRENRPYCYGLGLKRVSGCRAPNKTKKKTSSQKRKYSQFPEDKTLMSLNWGVNRTNCQPGSPGDSK